MGMEGGVQGKGTWFLIYQKLEVLLQPEYKPQSEIKVKIGAPTLRVIFFPQLKKKKKGKENRLKITSNKCLQMNYKLMIKYRKYILNELAKGKEIPI